MKAHPIYGTVLFVICHFPIYGTVPFVNMSITYCSFNHFFVLSILQASFLYYRNQVKNGELIKFAIFLVLASIFSLIFFHRNAV